MGVGKTTFARKLLEALQVTQPPEGSPTFAIAHEYESAKGCIVHIDFYRLRSEDELDDAGIPSYFWEKEAIVISEWLSSWPKFESQVLKSGRIWKVDLSFADPQTLERKLCISRLAQLA
jgi:tRNA threonylcarbamoyl adenosine modification protein YjeE